MRLQKSNSPKIVCDLQLGFTLIEVMVALAIVAILASIAYPSYQESVLKAKRMEGRAALLQLMQQEERYYTQHNTYIPFSSSSTDADEKKFKWFSGENPATSFYEITATACNNETIKDCVLLTAKPGTPKVNIHYLDTLCGNLTLTSTGIKGADHQNCWK